MTNHEPVLTAAAAAKQLGTNVRNVTRWAALGILPARRLNREWLFHPVDLIGFQRPTRGNPNFGPGYNGKGKKQKKSGRRKAG